MLKIKVNKKIFNLVYKWRGDCYFDIYLNNKYYVTLDLSGYLKDDTNISKLIIKEVKDILKDHKGYYDFLNYNL